jgi:hypothetical protein
VYIYDIENKVLSDNSYAGLELYGFANGDSQFYFCSPTGMSSGELFVMDLPGFEVNSLATVDDMIGTCGPFDSTDNVMTYVLNTWDEMNEEFEYHTYEYDLDDGTLTEV